MSGERIIRRIRDEAESEKKKIENETERLIAVLQAEGKAEAEKRYSEMMDSAGKEREMAANRIIAQARLQAREKVRNARDDNISLCFERAKEEIRIIRHSEKYPSVLELLIENGIQELEENNVVLDICSEDMPIIRELIPKFESKGYNLLVSTDTIHSEGGVKIRSRTRSIHVNNTFEARMERYRTEILYEVAKILAETDIKVETEVKDD